MAHKTSNINIQVGLDENNIPEQLRWEASDTGEKAAEAKAILMSIWDEKTKETLRIDLWTKDMRVDEMKHFFHQTLVSMADTLERATSEDKMAADMRDFCHHFAEKLLQS
tara:strand:- start:51 stop:380 length:330 start_codon:yes stop_codon:yes gene_type:complete